MRGALGFELAWRTGRLTRMRIEGKPGTAVRLRYQGRLSVVTLDRHGAFASDGALPVSTT